MKKFIFAVSCLFVTALHASDSLQVSFSAKTLKKGDSLEFTCTVPGFAGLNLVNATLNVWIDDIKTHKRWKFRYPMVNGEVSASLAISDKIPAGYYAVNFLVQRGFFKLTGEILDHYRKDTTINSMMILKNKKGSLLDNTPVTKDGNFRLKTILFEDSAYFIFTPNVKVSRNYLIVQIETPLDSAFTPVVKKTDFITVGIPPRTIAGKTDTASYSFSLADYEGTLPGVTVTTKQKTKMQQFDEEYSHALFYNPDAILFDGLESSQIERSADIFHFLMGRVPGLNVGVNGTMEWRGHGVTLYLDEFAVSANEIFSISPADVAMIKVFRPPAAAVAIYTKRGAYRTNRTSRHTFIVRGYNKMDSRWDL